MTRGCTQEGCAVAETGSCALAFDPQTCPHRMPLDGGSGDTETNPDDTRSLDPSYSDPETDEEDAETQELAPPTPSPSRNPSFPSSFSLGPADVERMMSRRYCHLVGVVGAPDAGKTAALVSLYLLLARAELKTYRYADSETLRGLDEISRGARRWNEGQLPDQLTERTESADDRQAGFLHLRVAGFDGVSADLLLPDLPGEWSRALVDTNRFDRLAFLQRADVIWLMVDGEKLATPETRQLTLHRTKLLMQRLAGFLAPIPPVLLVVTRIDKGDIPKAATASLAREADSLGLSLTICGIASFADPKKMKPGTGIEDLLHATLGAGNSTPPLWPHDASQADRPRAMQRFGVAQL